MPKCTICHHPERQAIDCALLADNDTYAALSQHYGLSISALWRHKKHLQEKIRQTEKRLENSLRQETLFRYNDFLESTRQIVRTASADGDTRQVLRAVREGTRILNFITKLEVKFDPDTVYRILASPQWVSQDSLLPTDPGIITGTHQTLADDLFFPCPEIPSDPQAEAWDAEDAATADLAQTSFLETPNSALETSSLPPESTGASGPGISSLFPLTFSQASALPPGITQEQLQQILTRLDHRPANQPKTENRQLATENPPKNQREISAKLARKISPLPINYKEYQDDKQYEKIAAKNPCVGRESTRRAAYAQAHPAVEPSCSLPVVSHPPATGNRKPETLTAPPAVNCLPLLDPSIPLAKTACQQLETQNSELETPPTLATGNRKPETNCPELETPHPPVAPDPFLQAFPYLVRQTRSP